MTFARKAHCPTAGRKCFSVPRPRAAKSRPPIFALPWAAKALSLRHPHWHVIGYFAPPRKELGDGDLRSHNRHYQDTAQLVARPQQSDNRHQTVTSISRASPWRTHSCVQRSQSCEREMLPSSSPRFPRTVSPLRRICAQESANYTAAILASDFLDSHIPQGYQGEALPS
jgi:hypothetical protein